jgi:Domain of unknown function (DUF4112)
MARTARPEDFAAAGQPSEPPSEIERVRTLTRALDHYLLDPLLGLILPGAGDLVGSLLGLYVVVIAVRRRMSPVVIARMLLNLALDAGLGLVPVLGDLVDFAFKANQRNLALLVERQDGGKATARDWLAVGGAGLALAAVLGLVVYAVVAVISTVASWR